MISALRRLRSSILCAAALALSAATAFAGWPPDGFPIANTPNDEHSPVGMTGSDGNLYAFWVSVGAPDYAIFAQQMTLAGSVENGWPAGGRGVITTAASPDTCGSLISLTPREGPSSPGSTIAWRAASTPCA